MYHAVLLVDINSLRSTRCKEYNSSHIPPDLNKTNTMASYSNIIYFNNTRSTLENIKN